MSDQYTGYIMVANNFSTGINVERDQCEISVSLEHTCNGSTTTIMDEVAIPPFGVSQPFPFVSQKGHDDNWKMVMIDLTGMAGKFSGTFRANYEQIDSPGVVMVNIHWDGMIDEYDADFMFPNSKNGGGALTHVK